jgi:hypothetical protein
LYRLTSLFASVTTCDIGIGQHALLGPLSRRFHLLLFTQPFDFYLYLPQQPVVCLSTLQSGGLDYHLRGELRCSTNTGRRLTESADLIHFILTPDILVVTEVDGPCLVGLALLENRHYCVAPTLNRMLTSCVFHSNTASTTACALMPSLFCVSRASNPILSLNPTSAYIHAWVPRYPHICVHVFDHCVSLSTNLCRKSRKLPLEVDLGSFLSLLCTNVEQFAFSFAFPHLPRIF